MDNNRRTQFEDIYSDSSKERNYKRGHKPLEQREIVYPNKFVEFLAKDNKKNTKRLLVGILVFLVLFIVFLVVSFINSKLDLISFEDGGEVFTGHGSDVEITEDFDEAEFEAMHEVSDAASLDDLLKKWYQLDGSIMDQDYIINVLLIGIDGKGGVKRGGNSDSLILVSINKKTEKITLCSFMRDSRTYFEVNGRSRVAKINATYSAGGAQATVETLEKNYKIDIDYYVAVDFTSFPKVIDALGGITVDMKEYEQKYINRTTSKIKKIPNYGEVHLDGDQALVYARIRKCDADSDVSRTRRQRGVITAIIQSAKGASLAQLNATVDTMLPLLATDCTKNKILSYGAQAVTQGWMNYEIQQLTMPDEETRAEARIGGLSFIIVDYPVAAQKVQLALYGTTNIELDYNRDSAFDFIDYSSNYNNNYTNSTDSTTVAAPEYSEEYSYVEETTTRRGILDWWTRPVETTTAGVTEETTNVLVPPVEGETTTAVPQTQTPPVEEPSATVPATQAPETTTRSIISILDQFTIPTEAESAA